VVGDRQRNARFHEQLKCFVKGRLIYLGGFLTTSLGFPRRITPGKSGFRNVANGLFAARRGYREPFVIQMRICADVDRYAFSIPLPCYVPKKIEALKGTIDEA
jgi:hypothetical protein